MSLPTASAHWLICSNATIAMKNTATVILDTAEYFVMFCLIISKGGGEARVFDKEGRHTHIHEHTRTRLARTHARTHARIHVCIKTHSHVLGGGGRVREGEGEDHVQVCTRHVNELTLQYTPSTYITVYVCTHE